MNCKKELSRIQALAWCVTSFEANSSKKVSLKIFQGGWASEIELSVTIPFLSYWAIISSWKFPGFPMSAPWSWCYRAFPVHCPAGLGGCLSHHLGLILLGWWENDNPEWFPWKVRRQLFETGIPTACRDLIGSRLTHLRFTCACSPMSLKCLIQLADGILWGRSRKRFLPVFQLSQLILPSFPTVIKRKNDSAFLWQKLMILEVFSNLNDSMIGLILCFDTEHRRNSDLMEQTLNPQCGTRANPQLQVEKNQAVTCTAESWFIFLSSSNYSFERYIKNLLSLFFFLQPISVSIFINSIFEEINYMPW